MFTIDLLKGQGIPIRNRPENVAVAVVTFAVPVIVVIVMFGFYLRSKIVISIQEQGIVNYETRIDKLSDAVELQKSFEKEKSEINNCMSEISSSIGRHTQWSPVLTTLVTDMPGSVMLTQLLVKQHSVRRKVPQKDNPKVMTDISVPVRTLQMSVKGYPSSNCDKVVKDFRDSLRFSTSLGPKLEDIRVSQEFDTIDDRDVVSYEIDCVFKPGL